MLFYLNELWTYSSLILFYFHTSEETHSTQTQRSIPIVTGGLNCDFGSLDFLVITESKQPQTNA